ncbi:MAG: hypothetical protein M3326_00040 [Actinomycetota bacterium]|nr:hypothetical protein [Actinomycetota bacterium]
MHLNRSERGSLPIVMLAILVIDSVLIVLLGNIVAGQRQVRFDQGYEQSLQVAEAGLERMIFLIRSGQRTDSFSVPGTRLGTCGATQGLAEVLGQCWTVVPGGRYLGTATAAGLSWDVVATGTAANGTSRTIGVTVRSESPFGVAAFGKVQMVLNGGNAADSFDSRVDASICRAGAPADPFHASDTADTRACRPTGHGVVATNGELNLLGGTADVVDGIEIHYAKEHVPQPLTGATGFCAGVPQTCASPKLKYYAQPIRLIPDPYVPPDDLPNKGPFTGTTLEPGRQLYTNVRLDSNTVIKGTPANPTILYLTGTLTVPNGAVVNFQQGADGRWRPKPAPGLLVFSAGVGPALGFGNHASFAGAVFAPRATFSGGAAGNVYGSMTVGSFSTAGTWNFHYDDALDAVKTNAQWKVSDWSER